MAAQSKSLTLPEVQSAFTGGISPARLSWLYRVGLAVVAGTMVLLPLCYIGLIALWGWLIKWHLAENVWLMSGRSARAWRGIAYIGPAVAGVIMFFFLVKPLFARAPRREDPIRLDPDEEPVLFAFIERICDEVCSPRPSRVVVDCQVNASASFERGLLGLLRRRLVLTIGLPLAAGLSARQLGGVLAHEFGHFAQGAGMGLTFVIRSVNGWFARVVYQRDEWDERLRLAARDRALARARRCLDVKEDSVRADVGRKCCQLLHVTPDGVRCRLLRGGARGQHDVSRDDAAAGRAEQGVSIRVRRCDEKP